MVLRSSSGHLGPPVTFPQPHFLQSGGGRRCWDSSESPKSPQPNVRRGTRLSVLRLVSFPRLSEFPHALSLDLPPFSNFAKGFENSRNLLDCPQGLAWVVMVAPAGSQGRGCGPLFMRVLTLESLLELGSLFFFSSYHESKLIYKSVSIQ